MKREDTTLIIIAIVLVAIIAVSLVAHYRVSFTGRAITSSNFTCPDGAIVDAEENCPEIVPTRIIIEPPQLSMNVEVGEDSSSSFVLFNTGVSPIVVDCVFSEFDIREPDSLCYTYDDNGNFLGELSYVPVPAGASRQFTVGAYTYDDAPLRDENGRRFDYTSVPGTFVRDVVIRYWPQDDESKVKEVRIPLEIVVEN